MYDLSILTESTIDLIFVDAAAKEVRIELSCPWLNGVKKQISAKRVVDFLVCEMRLSNVIEGVSFLEGSSNSSMYAYTANRLFFLMRGVEPIASDLEWSALQDMLKKISEGSLKLLECKAIYGADVLILAEHFAFD